MVEARFGKYNPQVIIATRRVDISKRELSPPIIAEKK